MAESFFILMFRLWLENAFVAERHTVFVSEVWKPMMDESVTVDTE